MTKERKTGQSKVMPGRLRPPPATRSVPSFGSASGGLRGESQVSRIFGKRNKNICQLIDRACLFVLLARTCLFLLCRLLEINNEVCSLHLMGRVVHKPLGVHVVFELPESIVSPIVVFFHGTHTLPTSPYFHVLLRLRRGLCREPQQGILA